MPRVDTLSYTAAGLPWIDHEWLSTGALRGALRAARVDRPVALQARHRAGHRVARLAERSRRAARSPWVRGPVMVLTSRSDGARLRHSPADRHLPRRRGAARWLDRLDDARRRPRCGRHWQRPRGFALWANAHGGFIVGIGILALFALLRAAAQPPRGQAPRPRTFGSLRFIDARRGSHRGVSQSVRAGALRLHRGRDLRAPHPLTEWQPMHPVDPAHLPISAPARGAGWRRCPSRHHCAGGRGGRSLVAMVAVMALRQQRHVPLLALCAAAPLADQMRRRARLAARRAGVATVERSDGGDRGRSGSPRAIVQLAALGATHVARWRRHRVRRRRLSGRRAALPARRDGAAAATSRCRSTGAATRCGTPRRR